MVCPIVGLLHFHLRCYYQSAVMQLYSVFNFFNLISQRYQ